MKTDIYQKIESDFKEDKDLALREIDILEAKTKGLIGDRLLRAMVYLANGDINEFKAMIKLSEIDYRDLLWQAEYECTEERKRDFNKSFHELGLIKKDGT